MHTCTGSSICLLGQTLQCDAKLYIILAVCFTYWGLILALWAARDAKYARRVYYELWPVWRASVWRPVWAVCSLVWDSILIRQDPPSSSRSWPPWPPRNPICRTNNSQQMGRQKMTWAISNVLQSSFQIWDGHMLFSVFCTSNLIGIYCHISHLTWVHVIFCIWSSRRPQPAVTGVISNKKLQILTKGEKATHSQLPPRESWVNMTWWMQWMSDLNREIFQFSKNLNLEKLSGYNNMNAINAWIEPCNIWVFLALW